jgi:hypothetical protein
MTKVWRCIYIMTGLAKRTESPIKFLKPTPGLQYLGRVLGNKTCNGVTEEIIRSCADVVRGDVLYRNSEKFTLVRHKTNTSAGFNNLQPSPTLTIYATP